MNNHNRKGRWLARSQVKSRPVKISQRSTMKLAPSSGKRWTLKPYLYQCACTCQGILSSLSCSARRKKRTWSEPRTVSSVSGPRSPKRLKLGSQTRVSASFQPCWTAACSRSSKPKVWPVARKLLACCGCSNYSPPSCAVIMRRIAVAIRQLSSFGFS